MDEVNRNEDKHLEVCPACGVKIENGDKVIFSMGAPGTRSRLWARVCQFAKKPGCINQDTESIGEIKATDYYGKPEDLQIPIPQPKPLAAVVSNIQKSVEDL